MNQLQSYKHQAWGKPHVDIAVCIRTSLMLDLKFSTLFLFINTHIFQMLVQRKGINHTRHYIPRTRLSCLIPDDVIDLRTDQG